MSDLKPLVLLPLPKGHVLRKEVDWVFDDPTLIRVNASAGMIVDEQNTGYTTYEHWPEGVERRCVVVEVKEPAASEWPAACGVSSEPFRVEAGKRYVRRDGKITGVIHLNDHSQFCRTDGQLAWTVDGRFLGPITESPTDLVAEYLEPPKPADTRQGPDEPGEGWRFLAPEEMPIEGDQYWSVNIWEPSGNWEHNEAQAPEMKYRRRVDRSMGPVERALTIENQTLKAQCERQAETIRELELLTADRSPPRRMKDHVHYVIDFNQPSQSELQAKIEALELQAAEYKARCEQLQDRNTELRKQNERQITMVREEFARSSELQSSVGELRWERRKPTEEEMWNCYYLTRSPVGLVVWTPGEKDESSECWTEVCILPDILPAVEPKTVTEWLWFVYHTDAEQWVKEYVPEGDEPQNSSGAHRTETTRERVVD